MIPIQHYLILGAAFFAIGLGGVLTRRNMIIVVASIEIMLNGVNLTFVSLSQALGLLEGQVAFLFIMTIAAAEVSVGLSIIILIYLKTGRININVFDKLRG